MIKQGYKPRKFLWFKVRDHRDYSHKSFGAVQVPFPPEYNTDAGLTMPNQDVENDQYTPPVPPLPYGCTCYLVAEIAIDLGTPPELVNPMLIENITHANAKGGCDLREAMKTGVQLGLFSAFFAVEALNGQDYFDAVYDAQLSGGTEKRSIAIGSKWLPPFETVGADGILPMPFNFSDPNATWHAWKNFGRKMIGDQPYAQGKSWQGPNYGNKGICSFSRPLFNQLMSIPGTEIFVATKGVLPPISTISVTYLQWLMSWACNLLPY